MHSEKGLVFDDIVVPNLKAHPETWFQLRAQIHDIWIGIRSAVPDQVELRRFVVEAVVLLNAVVDQLPFPSDIVSLPSIPTRQKPITLENIDRMMSTVLADISDALEEQLEKDRLKYISEAYQERVESEVVFEFTDTDFERMQELIDQLRRITMSSPKLSEAHRRRLLRRIERVQSELHKRMSDLDVFWALVGEAGIALGRFGNDLLPLVECISKILSIVMGTSFPALGLSADYRPPLDSILAPPERDNTVT